MFSLLGMIRKLRDIAKKKFSTKPKLNPNRGRYYHLTK